MRKSPKLEEDKNIEEDIIKDIRNLFRLKKLKRTNKLSAIKGIRNCFRLKKENKVIKDRKLRDTGNLFKNEDINKPPGSKTS